MSANPGTARGTVLIENSCTRVTEWMFANRGDNTGWHRHEFPYVVIPMLDGKLDILDAHGETTVVMLHKGEPYYRNRGVEHDVISANDFPFTFIEVEFLD